MTLTRTFSHMTGLNDSGLLKGTCEYIVIVVAPIKLKSYICNSCLVAFLRRCYRHIVAFHTFSILISNYFHNMCVCVAV